MSDPAKYRTREEVQGVRDQRDPIDRLRKLMLERGLAGEDGLKEIDKEIRAQVNQAATFAQDSPEPDPGELYTDVYLETPA
jgi:pyruvate dehydrogenase E1 component alpha subunit